MPIPFAAISAGIGLVSSVDQFFSSRKSQKDAEEALNNFRRQELINPYEDIQISRLKSEQQTDANLSNMATSVDALQRTGARGVLAGIPRLSENNILLQNQISQDLEQQDVNRSMLIAQGEERIRQVREARELGAIQGLGNQAQVGRQDAASATTNFATSLLALGDSQRKNGVPVFDSKNTSFDQAQSNGFKSSLGSNDSFLTGGINSFPKIGSSNSFLTGGLDSFPKIDDTEESLNPAFNLDSSYKSMRL
jgi:hypothetical protein